MDRPQTQPDKLDFKTFQEFSQLQTDLAVKQLEIVDARNVQDHRVDTAQVCTLLGTLDQLVSDMHQKFDSH